MKKRLALLLGVTLAIPTAFAFAGCGGSSSASNNPREVYAFSAISSAEYLSSGASLGVSTSRVVPLLGQLPSTPPPATEPPTEIKDQLDEINVYTGMFDDFLGNKVVPVSSIPTQEDGIYSTYSTKLSVSIAGQTFTLYYNETIDPDGESGGRVLHGDDDDEFEQESSLNGVILYGSEVFEISGGKEIEVEGDESELEIFFTTRSKTNPNNYVTVKQEIENDEIEYVYEVFEDGSLVSKTEIKWENERNNPELELVFITISGGSPSDVKYKFIEKRGSQGRYLQVRYYTNNSSDQFTITEDELYYNYTFSNGYQTSLNK